MAEQSGQLTAVQKQTLAELEKVVEGGMRGFVQVGTALLRIRDERLYREVSDNFEGYCQIRWGFSRHRAYQLIEAANVVRTLGAECQTGGRLLTMVHNHDPDSQHDSEPPAGEPPVPPPSNERQARALAEVPRSRRAGVWKEAVETAPRDERGKPQVTATHVRRVARDAAESSAPPEAPNGEEDALGREINAEELPHVAEAFALRGEFRSLMKRISDLKGEFERLSEGPAGAFAERNVQRFNAEASNLHATVRFCMPHAICPYCAGNKCDACRGSGWLPEDVYKAVPSEIREGAGDA